MNVHYDHYGDATREPRRSDQYEPEWRGERLIDAIYFWNEFPIIGRWITNRLADQLDACSLWLETFANPKPPTGGSGVKVIAASPPPVPMPQPRIGPQGVTTCANHVVRGGYVHVPTSGQVSTPYPGENWYCNRCASYFPNEFLATHHSPCHAVCGFCGVDLAKGECGRDIPNCKMPMLARDPWDRSGNQFR